MEKKEARKILGVGKEISRNDLERRYSILMKKHRMAKVTPYGEDEQDVTASKQEGYSFEQITQAYNVLMGYEVPMKEEPLSKAAPLLKKAGIDEKKAKNFFYYYKMHIIIIIIAIITIVFTVRGCVLRVDPDFTTAFVGQIYYSETDKLKEMVKENIPEIVEPGFDGAFISDGDQGEQQYAMVMKAMVLFAAADVDVFILDKVNFEKYAKSEAFISLDEIALELGADMEKNKEYRVKIEKSEDLSETGSADNSVEGSEEAHLYGIDISQSAALKEAGIVGNEMIATIYANCKQQDKAIKLLQFLMKE